MAIDVEREIALLHLRLDTLSSRLAELERARYWQMLKVAPVRPICEALDVSPDTLRKWAKIGGFGFYQIGRKSYVSINGLRRFILSHRI